MNHPDTDELHAQLRNLNTENERLKTQNKELKDWRDAYELGRLVAIRERAGNQELGSAVPAFREATHEYCGWTAGYWGEVRIGIIRQLEDRIDGAIT